MAGATRRWLGKMGRVRGYEARDLKFVLIYFLLWKRRCALFCLIWCGVVYNFERSGCGFHQCFYLEDGSWLCASGYN